MKKLKPMLSVLLAFSIFASNIAFPLAYFFPDVNDGETFRVYIENLANDNVINGYSDGLFRSNEFVTRGAMAKFVKRGLAISTDTSCDSFFDVPETHVFYEDITTLKCKGIINGQADGSFDPEAEVERGAAMKFIVNAARENLDNPNFLPVTQNDVFPDLPRDNTFYEYVMAAYSASIVNGNEGLFKPSNHTTRGEMAKMIDNTRVILMDAGSSTVKSKSHHSSNGSSTTPTPGASTTPTTSPTATPSGFETTSIGIITNLNMRAVLTEDWFTVVSTEGQSGGANVSASSWSTSAQAGVHTIGIMTEEGFRLVHLNVNFTGQDLDWGLVSGAVGNNKAFFHYPGGFSQIPGATGNGYTLYVPKGNGTMVGICPGADTLAEINENCSGVYYLDESAPNVTVEWHESVEYWVVSGLTSTGGFSLIGSFNLKDTLTRLEVSQPSDHEIEFGTRNGISDGDSILITFQNGFDLQDIVANDIDLSAAGADRQLCTDTDQSCAAGVDTWGVTISSSGTGSILFSAPTNSGSAQYVGTGTTLIVQVGENATAQTTGVNQIVNPTSSAEYEVLINITNGDGTDHETGEIEIPIVDDDTVNITGFIDTIITFDIDTTIETGSTLGDCTAAGGANPCDSYAGATDNVGYVVDLGEMSTGLVNVSDTTSVLHADGNTGTINSIFFDLETNAVNGASVTVQSLNGGMRLDGSNIIPSVTTTGEIEITAGSGLFGIKSIPSIQYNGANSGVFGINDNCDGDTGTNYYCGVSSSSAIEIFNTNAQPMENGRIEFAVGASPDNEDATGTYSDELTFIATSYF